MSKTTYVWDELSDNVIDEYEDGALSVSYNHEPGLFGNLLSQHRNGVTSYYHYDGRGDTVALTDDSGDVTDTKEYDAWGNVVASTGSTVTPYQMGGMRGIQRMNANLYYYTRSVYQSSSTGRRLSSQLLQFNGSTRVHSYASTFVNDSREKDEQPVSIVVSYGKESIGPKCGQYSYVMHVAIHVTEKWYNARLSEFGVDSSPELLVFQHFHEDLQNDGCVNSSGCGFDRCTRGSLNINEIYDFYEFVDWNVNQTSGAKQRFVPRRNPKTRSLINYAIGFADEHSESGALHYGMCIDNDCVQRKTYQHVRIFWKDYTTHKSTNAAIDFDSDNWGGGDILVGNRRISGNLKKDRPTWWDSVRPAFVLMLLHDHSFCCCPDSFDVGAIKHYWAGSRPTWWY